MTKSQQLEIILAVNPAPDMQSGVSQENSTVELFTIICNSCSYHVHRN